MVGGPAASVAEWSRRRSCLRCPRRPERPSHLPHPLAPARHAPSARARPLPTFLHPDWSVSLGRRRELLAPPERGEQRSPGREANETVSESSGRVPLPHRPRPARASFPPRPLRAGPGRARRYGLRAQGCPCGPLVLRPFPRGWGRKAPVTRPGSRVRRCTCAAPCGAALAGEQLRFPPWLLPGCV